MAHTNRSFDDAKIIAALHERYGLQLPDNIIDLRIEVEYLAPAQNLPRGAAFNVSFRLLTAATKADEILREQI